MKLLIDKPHISIWHDQTRNWLYADWKGNQSYETVLDGGTHILELAAKTRVQKILNDNRQVTSAWSDAANEGGSQWFPALYQVGVRYFAWVYSPHAFSRLSTDIAVGYAKIAPQIAVFNSIDEAEEWLGQADA